MHRVRKPSPSPSRETDMGLDTTQSDGQRRDSKHEGAELAHPVMLDLKQEADPDIHPFSFKPLQLASLVDPKSLETFESMAPPSLSSLLARSHPHQRHLSSYGSGCRPFTVYSGGNQVPLSHPMLTIHGP